MVYARYQLQVPESWKRAILLLVILMLLDWSGMIGWVRAGAGFVLRPLVVATANTQGSLVRSLRGFSWSFELANRNLDLERRNAELLVLADQTQQLLAENAELRKELSVVERAEVELLRARVVAIENNQYRVWTEGEASPGQMVLHRGRVVGVVNVVLGDVALVDKLGVSAGKILVRKTGEAGESGFLLDLSREALELVRVPQERSWGVGEMLVTVGNGAGVLPDYVVGTVASFSASIEDLYAEVRVALDSKILVGDDVYVVKGER
jgi:cell shape-determining protein MreC